MNGAQLHMVMAPREEKMENECSAVDCDSLVVRSRMKSRWGADSRVFNKFRHGESESTSYSSARMLIVEV